MRVLQCWKYLLPIFQNSGRKNYMIEAFKLLYQYYYGLLSRHAQQLLWSRFINTQGIHGKNIPMDLHQKHLNRVCKTSIEALGPNKRGGGIVRCSKALGTMQLMLENFDRDNTVGQISDTTYSRVLCQVWLGGRRNRGSCRNRSAARQKHPSRGQNFLLRLTVPA